ncbi:TonB-dependent receptor [Fontisphaera persica]|uniref:TonB-dependent receptor plug domain-containing protein n=1 Tax=Fontisphaera persica TaxID=2974023 RepID=UPI0024BF687D|nr:TonB-dependent receptor [Fontisphaera persica]WCJ58603.1 TonB-dependent receptor [Fontisphaera persica]
MAAPMVADTNPPAPATAGGPALLELELEQLLQMRAATVEGASRRRQPTREAPSAVTLLTAEDIQKNGWRTLSDALNSVPGLYTTNDRDFWYLGARGFNRPGDYNSRYLLLINGHRLNNAIYDSAPIGPEFPVDLDLIERIEVIPGPGAAMYGNNAFFGVINVITKKGRDIGGMEASASMGSHVSGHGRFTYGQYFTNSGVELLLSGDYGYDPGPRQLTFTDATGKVWTSRRRDSVETARFFSSLSWRDWSLSAAVSRAPNGIPSGVYASDPGDPRAEWEEQYGYLEVKWDHSWDEDRRLTARGYYNYYRYLGWYPYGGIRADDRAVGQDYGAEVQFNAKLWERHVLTLGANLHHAFHQDQSYEDETGFIYLNDHQDHWLAGGFAQVEWLLHRTLRLNTGGRLDYHSRHGAEANPRLSLIYQPWQRTTFKALYGTAYRAPSVFEMYYGFDGGYVINPALRPETITTYELVWEQQFTRRLALRMSAYYYCIEELISMEPQPGTGYLQFQNLDHVRATGLETALEYRLPHGWRWRGSYAVQRNRMRGVMMDNSPQHLVKNHLSIPLYRDRWWLNAECLYSSDTTTGMPGVEANDYWLLNLTLWSRPLGKNLEFSASVYNVLGHKYAYPVGDEYWANSGPLMEFSGREFRVKFTYRF